MKLVSLCPSLTELVFALERGEDLVLELLDGARRALDVALVNEDAAASPLAPRVAVLVSRGPRLRG